MFRDVPKHTSKHTWKNPKLNEFHGAEMIKKNTEKSVRSARRSEPNLDSRYGEIGISAVAAALPYRSEVKRPTRDAPLSGPERDRFADMAA
jgi:hypothetical protein